MATKQQNNTMMLAAGIGVALSALGWFTAIGPQTHHKAEYTTEAKTINMNLPSLDAKIADLKSKQSDMDTILGEVEDLTSKFPSTLEQGDWTSLVVNAGQKAGVTVTAISPSIPLDSATVGPDGQPIAVAPVAPVAVEKVQGNIHDDPNAIAAPVVPATTFPLAQVTVSITAESKSTSALNNFVAALLDLKRPMVISSVNIGTGTVTVTGKTYLTRPVTEAKTK